MLVIEVEDHLDIGADSNLPTPRSTLGPNL
jgi:hypothetical protein